MEDRVQDDFTNRSDESLESLKHPQQEMGGPKTSTDTELLRSILDNSEVLTVLHQKFKELEKTEGQSNWKKPLHVVVGFFQYLRARAMSLSSLKAVLLFFWTKLVNVFNMVSEIWKEKRTRLCAVQRNLKAVNVTHEKILGNVEEVEDQIRKAREIDYKISSTESKDLEIQLITAGRDLGDCEDGLIDVQRDVERLRAGIRWLKFVQIIGFVLAAVLAAGVLNYFFNQTSFFSSIEEDNDKGDEQLWKRGWPHGPANESVLTAVKGLTTAGFMMIVVSVAVLCLPLKWMIESLIITSWLLTECEKVLEDGFQKANHLQKKLKRAVEKEVPEMKKQLVVLECDISRYASLQKLDSD